SLRSRRTFNIIDANRRSASQKRSIIMVLRLALFAVAATSFAASPAIAQTTPPASALPADQAKQAKDPNEVVCEKQQDPGSRLVSAKVCHTRAEWADLRHQDRQMIDRAQTQLGATGK